jgi:PucR C-terminal helix-turn-helix domain
VCSADDAWAFLPHEMAPRMRSGLGDLAGEIIREIRRTIPEVDARVDERDDRTIRQSVGRALTEFVDRVADPGARTRLDARTTDLYRSLGRDWMLDGRSLEGLQAAYRLGGRLAWRRWVGLAHRASVPAPRMYQLAEAVFAYVDELAARTVEGYREAQTRTPSEQLESRRLLFEFLATTPDAPIGTVRELAGSAQWPVPEAVVAVALRPPRRGDARAPAPALWRNDALVDAASPAPRLLLPAHLPDVDVWLAQVLRGWQAAVGPAVRVTETAVSVRWAHRLLELAQHGLGSGRRVVHCDDHLSTLILLEDEALVRRLSAHRLAPLAKLTPKRRDRLAETMLAWLQCGGSAPEVAKRMQVHPQTVRYRLRQIEHLYGRALRDPDARFDLEIALRARVLLDRLSAKEHTDEGPAPDQSGAGSRQAPTRPSPRASSGQDARNSGHQ